MELKSCLNLFTLPFSDDVLKWLVPLSFIILFASAGLAYLADKKQWIKFSDAALMCILVIFILSIFALRMFWDMAGIDIRPRSFYAPEFPGCKTVTLFVRNCEFLVKCSP